MIKRIFDIVMATAGLAVLSPVLIWIAWKIKAEDHGPVFYRGIRVGLHRKPFRIFKFHTMVVNPEKLGGPSTGDDDPRITKIGKFLRKYKLDELPQLFNAHYVEIPFVSPRPEVSLYVDMFTEGKRDILSVRPGITDWASIWNPDEGEFLKGNPDPERDYLGRSGPRRTVCS